MKKTEQIILSSFGALFVGGLIAACGGAPGSATVDGDIGNYSLRASTVFAYYDREESNRDKDGKLHFKTRDVVPLYIKLDGASYDPRNDLRLTSSDELDAQKEQRFKNGYAGITVSDYSKVALGETIKIPDESTKVKTPVSASVVLGRALLNRDAEYPDVAPRFGTDEHFEIVFTAADDQKVQGTLKFVVDRKDPDPNDALTGSINITFDAVVVNERIAECNGFIGQNSGQACDLDIDVSYGGTVVPTSNTNTSNSNSNSNSNNIR